MGRATIVSETGEGLYTVALDYGSTIVNARTDVINARIAELDNQLDELQPDINAAASDKSAAEDALNIAIDNLRGAIGPDPAEYAEQEQACREATIELVEKTRDLEALEIRKSGLENEKSALEVEKTYLQGLEVEVEQDAWCVDYTTGATGEVATLEVPSDVSAVLIAPGAPQPAESDGHVQLREVQQPHQVYWNAAAFPAFQKWKPTWRFGAITAMNEDGTCNVVLDEVVSTQQRLAVNQTDTLENVPIDYMGVGGAVFVVDDRVVVFFDEQDWQQPKVIGFEKEPRAAFGILLLPYAHHADGTVIGSYGDGGRGALFGENQRSTLTYQSPAADARVGSVLYAWPDDDVDAVAWSNWINPWQNNAVTWSSTSVWYKRRLVYLGSTSNTRAFCAWWFAGRIYYVRRDGTVFSRDETGADSTFHGPTDKLGGDTESGYGRVRYFIAPNGKRCIIYDDEQQKIYYISLALEAESGEVTVSISSSDNAIAVSELQNFTLTLSGSYTGPNDQDVQPTRSDVSTPTQTLTSSKKVGVKWAGTTEADADEYQEYLYEIEVSITNSGTQEMTNLGLGGPDWNYWERQLDVLTTVTEKHTISGAIADTVVLQSTYESTRYATHTYQWLGGSDWISASAQGGWPSDIDGRQDVSSLTESFDISGATVWLDSGDLDLRITENYTNNYDFSTETTVVYGVAPNTTESTDTTATSAATSEGVTVDFAGTMVYQSPAWSVSRAGVNWSNDAHRYLRSPVGRRSDHVSPFPTMSGVQSGVAPYLSISEIGGARNASITRNHHQLMRANEWNAVSAQGNPAAIPVGNIKLIAFSPVFYEGFGDHIEQGFHTIERIYTPAQGHLELLDQMSDASYETGKTTAQLSIYH